MDSSTGPACGSASDDPPIVHAAWARRSEKAQLKAHLRRRSGGAYDELQAVELPATNVEHTVAEPERSDGREEHAGPVVLAGSEATGTRRARADGKREADTRDVTEAVLMDLSRSIEQCFDGITLQDLCSRGERVAMARRARASDKGSAYVI